MMCLCGKSGGALTDAKPWARDKDGEEKEFRIAVLGASGVGKSAICQRFLRTQGDIGGAVKIEEVDGDVSPLKVVEISTEFPFKHRDITMRQTIITTDGFILVYSVTDRRSLQIVQQLFSYILHVRRERDLPVVLVGNKIDALRERCLSEEEGRSAAFDLGVSFYESSAKLSNAHVIKLFHDCVRQVRCVRVRRELEREQKQKTGNGSGIGLCGARGIVDRISFRSKSRKKVIVSNMIG